MIEINKDVVYVKGALNGALYDFNTGKVFSVNKAACEIIERYIEKKSIETDEKYLVTLQKNELIAENFTPAKFAVETDEEIRLQVAWIEITHACNLNCVHCYEGNEHRRLSDSLCVEQWKDVIDQLEKLNINRLIIIGGEPCCHPDVIEIINHAAQYDIDITLFTNGTCFTDRLIETIIRTKIKVKVSVYGHCAEVHDSVTSVPGSFDKMMKAVKRLVENGISVSSAVIIMKENELFAQEILEYVKTVGMNCSRYDVIREVYGGIQNPHIPTDKQVMKNVYLTKPNFKADKKLFCNNFRRNSCWYGKIAIQENGDVIPCEFERDYVYGNVTKRTISEIIYSEKTKKMWFMSFDQVEECGECEFRFACHDCRPLGKAVCGKLESKNPRCKYNVHEGVWEPIGGV